MHRTRPLAVAMVASFVTAAWSYTYDVYVPIDGNGEPGVGSFCGSAYDVVFIKKDGYMGGEMPPNQAEIDHACVARSQKYVAAAIGFAGGGGALLVALLLTLRRLRPGRGDRLPAGLT